jgi:arylsulfatase A-like enzyme
MKVVMPNLLLPFWVLVGVRLFFTSLSYCNINNVSYKASKKEAKICNSHNQVDVKESYLPAKGSKQFKRPNVLLIGIETLRADHVGCLGYSRNTTPTLDKLAKEGVVFSKAIATSSWTMPTVMSVFTSLYPGIHRTTNYQKKLPNGINTLAEILKENGYMTTAFVGNPTLDNRFGFSKGFYLYDDFTVQMHVGFNLFKNNDMAAQLIHNVVTNSVVNCAAINWLQKNYLKVPFFMFVFYFDPHYDYIPPPPFDTIFDPNYNGSIDGRGIAAEQRKSTRPPQRDLDHIIALYDGEILHTNSYISKLLGKFAEYDLLGETLVIVFGDHGDEFYEHGSTAHAHTLYNELIHVPLIFRWPSTIPQSRRVDAMVSQVDIMPTILDYLGIKHTGFMQGSSLRPLIEGRENKLHDLVYAEVGTYIDSIFSAVISKDYKFILNLKTNEKQLFDMNSDLNEQINIYKRSPNGPIHLESHLSLWLVQNEKLAAQLFGNENVQQVELDENRLRQLKALGYIQ